MRFRAIAGLMLGAAVATHAGEWHIGTSLHCGECHAEHAQSGGTPIPGGPYSTLLRRANVNELCLSCHDGTDPTAPDVLDPVTMYAPTAASMSGGGHFVAGNLFNPAGHDIGQTAVIPLSSGARSIELSCGSCHDYHGNANYRNLLFDPAAAGDSINLRVGTEVFTEFPAAIPPTRSGSIAAYQLGNAAFRGSWAAWCGTCHDQVRFNQPAMAPAHFAGHPVEISFSGAGSDAHVSTSHWIGGTGEGFAGNNVVPGEGVIRLPFQNPAAIDLLSARQVSSSNQLSCMTCHSSHGSDFADALRWPATDGGVSLNSGCQQCHFK